MGAKKIEKKAVNGGIVFLMILVVSMLFAYPLVLFYPPGVVDVNFPFLVRVPIEIIICALSLAFLLLNSYKVIELKRSYLLSFMLYVMAVGGASIAHKSLPGDSLVKLGYLVVPMAVAVAVIKAGVFSQMRQQLLMYALGFMWLLGVVWSFCSGRPDGLSGNSNWFASTSLALAPWALFSLYHILRSLFSRVLAVGQANLISGFVAFASVASITVYWLVLAKSRGAWLALISFCILSLLIKVTLKWRIVLFTLILGVASSVIFSTAFKQAIREDIRGPLWTNTVNMAASSPGIGYGPGNFRKVYTLFRSPEHSIRLVSALSTEHPHNEFLYLAAEVGIPGALIWLFLVMALLFVRVRTREGHCARFGFIILLVHGFFDKGLVSPPGNILFWLFAGLITARWLQQKIKVQQHSCKVFSLALAASLLCLVPIALRVKSITKAQLEYRTVAALNSLHSQGLVKGSRPKVLKRLYDDYMIASDLDPHNVLYPYMALNIAVEKMRSLKLAAEPMRRVNVLDENYEHFNYFSARYHFQQAFLAREESVKKSHLMLADKLMALELRLHPYNLKVSKFIIDFLIDRKEGLRANNLYKYSNTVCANMFERKFAHKSSALALLEKWRVAAQEGRPEALQAATEILAGFKGIGTIDKLLPSLASSNGFMSKSKSQEFHVTDVQYWQEIFDLRRLFNKGKVGEALVKDLLQQIEINREQKFYWPGEVIKNKKGSELSVACLLRVAGHIQDYITFIVKVDTLDKVHWLVYMKNENEEFLVWPSAKKIVKVDFKKMDKQKMQKIIGDEVRAIKPFLFEYPQAFWMRNVYLSQIISSKLPNFRNYCFSPSLVKINLQRFLIKHRGISYLKQPFIRFEQDND
jgi:hypothetical protein